MSLAVVRADVAVIDELLREIASRKVDVSDPDWMAKLRQAPPPVEEAGVAPEAAAALEDLLTAYQTGGAAVREEVRDIFRAYPSFRWAVGLPRQWESVAEFRRRLVHVSARDQGADPRDELIAIWFGLCGQVSGSGSGSGITLQRCASGKRDNTSAIPSAIRAGCPPSPGHRGARRSDR